MLASQLIQAHARTFPLTHAENNDFVTVAKIYTDSRIRKRLADLGLNTGTTVRVIRCSVGSGPLILAVKHDARIALGHSMASKIMVYADETV